MTEALFGAPVLSGLLGSLPAAEFFTKYWEKQAVALDGCGQTAAGLLVSIDHLEEILAHVSNEGARDYLRLVKSEEGAVKNKTIPLDSRNKLDIFEIYRLYYAGWTIVINSLHRRWRPVTELERQLEKELGQQVGINLYFTPPRAQGFLPHIDGHDVFVLQIDGAKDWEIYDCPQELPLERQEAKIDTTNPGDPTLHTRLTPGQALYVPRGWVHRAFTSDESSIHLTIGLHGDQWRDLVSAVLSYAEENDVEFRKCLPAELFEGQKNVGATRRNLRKLCTKLLDYCDSDTLDQVFERYRKARIKQQPWPLNGHFAQLDRLEKLALDSEVRRHKLLDCLIEESGAEVCLHFSGNVVSAPKAARQAFEFIAGNEQFKVRDLPSQYSDASKMVMVARFIREGLLYF